MTFPDPLMTKADIAELLRCCERTVERQVRQGAFPPPQKFGKASLWFQSVVHAWLTKRREQQMQWAHAQNGCDAPEATAPDSPAPTPAHTQAQPDTADSHDGPAKKSRVAPRAAAASLQSVFSSEDLARAQGRACGATSA